MSQFSGKCDLADHLAFEKMYRFSAKNRAELVKRRNPDGSFNRKDVEELAAKTNDDEWSVGLSDELECFNEFKRKTGGIIYQHVKVEATKFNIEDLCRAIEWLEIVEDGYSYYGTVYKTLRQLNKHGVYLKRELHFDTLLDLLPYYPYIIACASCSEGKETIIITNESFVEDESISRLNYHPTVFDSMAAFYRKELQEHYIDIVNRYFDYQNRTHTKTCSVFKIKDRLIAKLNLPAGKSLDMDYHIEIKRTKHDWIYSSPKAVGSDVVDVTDVWPGELVPGVDEVTLTYCLAVDKDKLWL